MRSLSVLALALALSPMAAAYTGPGLGLGVVGTVIGVVFALLLALLAVFWYPLKRALKLGKKPADTTDSEAAEENSQPSTESGPERG